MDFIWERSDRTSLCRAIPQSNRAKRFLVLACTGLFALSALAQTGQIGYKAAKDADSKKTLLLKDFHPQPMLHVPEIGSRTDESSERRQQHHSDRFQVVRNMPESQFDQHYRRSCVAIARSLAAGTLLTDADVVRASMPQLMVPLARSGDSSESVAAVSLMLELEPRMRHGVFTCNRDGGHSGRTRMSM